MVSIPATSTLFFTARSSPAKGSSVPVATALSTAAASARSSSAARTVIQISGRPEDSMAASAARTRAVALCPANVELMLRPLPVPCRPVAC